MYQCFFTAPTEPAYGAASSFTSSAPGLAGDFDFLHGQWLVQNCRLAEPFGAAVGGIAASSGGSAALSSGIPAASGGIADTASGIMAAHGGGVAFDSVHDCRPLASGGHLEEAMGEDGVAASVLRLFDARSRGWMIYRISPGDATLEAPLLGGFEDGVGTFIGDGTLRGCRVLVRETWVRAAENPRWEQAFSADGGRTWNTYWTRELMRVDWPQ